MTETKKQKTGIRIPAPTLTIIHITMAVLLGWLAPIPIPAPVFVQWIGLGFAALGFILGVLALIEFRRARAAADPKKPARKNFVTSGIYRYSRNPIYLGFVFMLVGLPLTMRTYWGVILVWPLIIFMNNMIIQHEEAYLNKEFNTQYQEYCSHVRRWL